MGNSTSILARIAKAGLVGLKFITPMLGLTPVTGGTDALHSIGAMVMLAESVGAAVKGAGGSPPDKFSMVFPAAAEALAQSPLGQGAKTVDPTKQSAAVTQIVNGVVAYLQSVDKLLPESVEK